MIINTKFALLFLLGTAGPSQARRLAVRDDDPPDGPVKISTTVTVDWLPASSNANTESSSQSNQQAQTTTLTDPGYYPPPYGWT